MMVQRNPLHFMWKVEFHAIKSKNFSINIFLKIGIFKYCKINNWSYILSFIKLILSQYLHTTTVSKRNKGVSLIQIKS